MSNPYEMPLLRLSKQMDRPLILWFEILEASLPAFFPPTVDHFFF